MSASPRYKTRDQDKVGFFEKTALGVGYLPVFFGYAAVGSFALPVYQMTLHLDPSLFGIAMAIPRFWDAITDPVMGLVSDNTHLRWGRRKPYIVVGSILQALAFGLIWLVPSTWSQPALFAYLVATLLLFYSCFTVFSVPLYSLTYEMTADPNERTRVSAFGAFFGKVGEFLYQWVFPLTGLAIFASQLQGIRIIGWLVAFLVFFGLGTLPGLFVKERYFKKAKRQEKVRILPSLRASLHNRAFVVLVALTVLQIVAGMLASNIDYYLLVYYMNDGDVLHGSIWKGILSTGYAIVGIALIPVVSWVANHLGKRTTLVLSFILVFIGAFGKWYLYTPDNAWPILDRFDAWMDSLLGWFGAKPTPGNLWKILIDPLFCGPVWVAINILTTSMLADVCDLDELQHGFRREGVFGSLFSWVQKTGYSLAFFGALSSLSLVGFDSALGGAQSPGTFLGMRLILTLSTGAWAILAIVVLAFYPLTQKRSYEIRDELEARRGAIGG